MRKKENINFSIFELLVNDTKPSLKQVKELLPEPFQFERTSESLYSVNPRDFENYFWFYVSYGFSHPLPEEVIDRAQGNALVKNPRKETQVEPTRQIFGLYVPLSGYLFLSSSKCSAIVKDMFSHNNKEAILIKHVLINPDEFLNSIKILSTIEISVKEDLLTHTTELFKSMQDDLGCEAPESYYLKATFEKSISSGLKNLFTRLCGEKRYGNLKRFVCAGRDEQGLETVFNADTFTKKVSIQLEKLENGLFDKECVKDALVKRLKELEVV